jgi:hypothetical protein
MRRLASRLSWTLGLALAACGGTPGADPGATTVPVAAASLFSGTYQVVSPGGTQGPAEEVVTLWGSAMADGIGSSSWTLAMNDGGVVNPPAAMGDMPFVVHDDRSMAFELAPHVSFADGGISEDGALAVLASVWAGMSPRLFLLARREGVFNDASLNGLYRLAGHLASVPGLSNAAAWADVTFDGLGGGTATLALDNEGVIVGPAVLPIVYAVSADGQLTLEIGALAVEGSLAAGGDVVLVGGGTNAGEFPSAFALVRAGAAMSDADFDGVYFAAALWHESATNEYHSFTGTLHPDGAGSATLFGTDNEEGVVTAMPADGATFTVAPDGALVLTTSGGDVLVGGLTQDGRYAALAGGTNAGADPIFVVLVR